MKYALLDWDFTVRNGYTLFSWIDYLCDKGILSSEIKNKENVLSEKYNKNEITHDEYADIACRYYAKELKNLNVALLENHIDEFIQLDMNSFFPFTRDLFLYFKEKNIKPIIISGAPENVIRKYKTEFNLCEIYAVREEQSNDYFTGNIEYNHGYEKGKIVDALRRKYGRPLFAFGDSSSDIPLLKAAWFPIVVFDDKPKIFVKNMITINRTESPQSVIGKLRECHFVAYVQSNERKVLKKPKRTVKMALKHKSEA